MSDAQVDDWTRAAVAAAADVVSQALGWDLRCVEPSEAFSSIATCGAYVPVSSADSVLQIGLMTDRAGCEAMSRALLAMGPDEPFESPSDVTDAFGEIANMIAGGVKGRMYERVPSLRIGLPLFVHGRVEQTAAEQRTIELHLNAVRAAIVVLRVPGSVPGRLPGSVPGSVPGRVSVGGGSRNASGPSR
jgi:CheY-specific phosphatase CheX